MPESGPPATKGGMSRARCMCYAGWSGERCEASIVTRAQRSCLNGCSARGSCVRNWCHCEPGYYGADCSIGAPGAPPAPPLLPPIGAQGAGAPRVYVYELPPRFNTWMHAGEHGWWQVCRRWLISDGRRWRR